MSDALKKVLEETVLSESAKASIMESFEKRILEAREEIADNLRDEFSLKFEKDKAELVEAMDIMTRDALDQHVSELAEAKKLARKEQVESKKKLKEALSVIESFVSTSLKKEMQEFHEDRKAVQGKLNEFESFIKESLAVELDEFHDEKRKLYEDRVQHKINASKELADAKKKLVKESVAVIEKFVTKNLSEEMVQLKQDLVESRKKHFGMKLFEAFASEYHASIFSERAEVKKLLKIIEGKEKKLAEASEENAKLSNVIVESNNKLRVAQDRAQRTKIMTELVSSLSGSKRKLMEELLEKVPTQKLTESYDAYLPAVLSENKSVKKSDVKVLSESTGNKETLLSKANAQEGSSVVNDILSSYRMLNNHAKDKNKI